MLPPYFELEELGVLVGVEELALLRAIYLLLQHTVVAVGYRLLHALVLLWTLVDRRFPHSSSRGCMLLTFLLMIGCITALIACHCFCRFRKVAVAQVVSFVEEEVERSSPQLYRGSCA